jgi:integrase
MAKKKNINFNLKNKSGENAEALVMLSATINGERVKVSTGQSAPVKAWNSKTQRCDENAEITERQKRAAKKLNKFLDELQEKAEEKYEYYSEKIGDNHYPQEEIAEDFKFMVGIKIKRQKGEQEAEDKRLTITPLTFIDNYVNSMQNKTVRRKGTYISKGTISSHKSAYKRLKQYMTDGYLSDSFTIFNRHFERDYRAWCNGKEYKTNTIAVSLNIIKSWLREAEKEGFALDQSYKEYSTSPIDVDNIYLTPNEIDRLYNLDLRNIREHQKFNVNNKIEHIRDLFIISCHTGLRLGDWSNLNSGVWDMTAGDETLTIITTKTKEQVIISLHPHVVELYNKYKGKFPKGIVSAKSIAHLKRLGEMAGIDDEILIKEIRGGKTITKKYKKWELIKNHTGRRSFATNAVQRGASSLRVMKITGHKTETSFMKYIKIDRMENAKTMREYIL